MSPASGDDTLDWVNSFIKLFEPAWARYREIEFTIFTIPFIIAL